MTSSIIGLCNPQNPANMGSIMRASGCFDAQAVHYTGQRFDKAKRFHTDTQASARKIPQIHTEDLLASVPTGHKIICIDLIEGAQALPEFTHPDNAFYVFGPEDGSISQALIDAADHAIYIPTIGCLNLAATVNIVLYDREAKQGRVPRGDEQIRDSRDGNNHTRLKTE